jgi:hypothetical protein
MKGNAVPNHRRKGKKVESNIDSAAESNIDSAAHNQALKQQRQPNERNHTYLSILTLNVNGLNSLIERPCLANCIKKEDLTICCL